MANEIKNIFISHVHEDDPVLPDLKKLVGKNGCEIRDASIDSSKPNDAKNESYIKTEILGPRIQWAGTMIVLISPNTHTSEWVNWEIEYAAKQNKRIIGVFAQGAQRLAPNPVSIGEIDVFFLVFLHLLRHVLLEVQPPDELEPRSEQCIRDKQRLRIVVGSIAESSFDFRPTLVLFPKRPVQVGMPAARLERVPGLWRIPRFVKE